jgi:hypothetical protein
MRHDPVEAADEDVVEQEQEIVPDPDADDQAPAEPPTEADPVDVADQRSIVDIDEESTE